MKKKTIALGISDFKRVVEGNHYLVDKSLFIKEAFTDGASVTLLPRPRRWGKTLNMSMLRYFFEKAESSERHLFTGLTIEQHPEMIGHQGKYPVIFLTLKDAKQGAWNECYDILQDVIIKEYERHSELKDSTRLNKRELDDVNAIINKTAEQELLKRSLQVLSACLHKHHGVEPIILLDEYDTPIIAGFENDYYKEVISFMRTFLGTALKDNMHLKKGFLTGILRISKESLFSGLNNLKICTLMDQQYSEYFGFSESEVNAMLQYYGPHENDTQMKLWYNNYYVGNEHSVYNPWSVINYIDKQRELSPHWMNSSNNLLIKEIIQKTPADFKEDLEQLMLGKTIEKRIVDFVTFDDLFKYPDVAYNFFLLTGYLSFEKKYTKNDKQYLSLIIPNKEAKLFYEDIVMKWLTGEIKGAMYQEMLLNLTSGNIESFKKLFIKSVAQSMSYFDVKGDEPEKFYHAFVLGMLISLQETHQVLSNRESGYGRYDVMVIPKDVTKTGIIIEFKVADDETEESFVQATTEALEQIKNKNYKADLESRGITQIINLAIIFFGKKVLIKEQ